MFLLLLLAVGRAAEPTNSAGAMLTRFNAVSGSKVTLSGEYGISEWHAEGTLLCGFLEVEPGFPKLPGPPDRASQVRARGEVFIPVRNLRAVGESRVEYIEQKTGIIHRMLHADDYPRINFWLLKLETDAPQPGEGSPTFLATGRLAIAGVTNQISLPLIVKPVENGAIQISGKSTIKLSDFGIIPKPTGFRCFSADPDPAQIAFDWLVRKMAQK